MSSVASGQPNSPSAENMKLGVSRSIEDVLGILNNIRNRQEIRVGFVPTMGFFHEGHLSLMRAARAECDFVVVSIFVNPAQFGDNEDLDSYPRDLERDIGLASDCGVDLVFAPEKTDMYPPGNETLVSVGSVAGGLCGQSRPGHFQGVATVVAKLFNIIDPDIAYFGQKDAQQAAVIQTMVRDLDFDVEIRICPTIREEDGLAMSSRNSYLSVEERSQAIALFTALTNARESVEAGETSAKKVKRLMKRTIGEHFLVEYEYARIVDPNTMVPVQVIDDKALAVVAARVGKARLIDNMLLVPREEECGE